MQEKQQISIRNSTTSWVEREIQLWLDWLISVEDGHTDVPPARQVGRLLNYHKGDIALAIATARFQAREDLRSNLAVDGYWDVVLGALLKRHVNDIIVGE